MMEINLLQQHVRRRVNHMRDRLHQHQQLQQLFIDGGCLNPAYTTTASQLPIAAAPDSSTSAQKYVDITTYKCINQTNNNNNNNNSENNNNNEINTTTMQSAGSDSVIITTHYYTSNGGRRTYHNYYYNYDSEQGNNISNNDTNSINHTINNTCVNAESENVISENNNTTTTSNIIINNNTNNNNNNSSRSSNKNCRQTKRPNSNTASEVTPKKPMLITTNNNNNTTSSSSNSNASTNNNKNSNNNSSSSSSLTENSSSSNIKNNHNNSIVDSAMLHAIREKVLRSPAGTNFDVMSVSTPNGGRTIATHSTDQLQFMRIFDHEPMQTGPVLTSSVPVSLLKERYLISHVHVPQKPASTNNNITPATTSSIGNIEPAPAATTTTTTTTTAAAAATTSTTTTGTQANTTSGGPCTTGCWYRHLADVSTTSLSCTDIFSEEEYICKVVNEPICKVRQAYFKLQEDNDFLRSTLYGHRLVRAAQEIVPYVSPMGVASTERTYVIVAQQTATAEEIEAWSPADERTTTIGLGGRVTGNVVEDLHSYIRRKRRLCELEARSLFHQICETVRLCHQNGIILRDLKLKRFYFIDNERYV